MELIFYGGIIIALVGLVLSHVVVAMTRGNVRKGEPMKRAHKIMMWTSVGLVICGFSMAAIWYFIFS